GLGVLVKGPITPAVAAGTVAALALAGGSAAWIRRLAPLPGLAWALALVAPWAVAILIVSEGAFLAQSVGEDFLAKVAQGVESHGAPPGTYAFAFLLAGWPLTPFLLLALPWLASSPGRPAVTFCLAWALPFWLVA